MATTVDGVDPEAGEAGDADADQMQETLFLQEEPQKPRRGHVGAIYEDIFKDLYDSPAAEEAEAAEGDPDAAEGDPAAAPAEGGSEAGSKTGDGTGRAPRPWEEIDLTGEDDEIAGIHTQLEVDHTRVDWHTNYLKEKWEHAERLDQEHREEMKIRPTGWEVERGLIVKDEIPIPDSQLKGLIHHGVFQDEKLAIPRKQMLHVERHIAIKTGVLAEHDNLLSVSKPDAPNYLKDTGSNMNRMTMRNIQPRLTEAQRTHIGADIDERNRQRPPMPKVLNAESRMKNLAIIKKMQTKVNFLKNPRYIADAGSAQRGESCPFRITPECITFRNYDVGGVYEVQVVLKNASGIGRHVRVMPCTSDVFSNTPMKYDAEAPASGAPSSVVAPGMSARFAVRFAPKTLNDQTDQILVRTELGEYVLPVLARRVQPQLEFEMPVNIGCILAGQFATKTFNITNHGGEGSFRLVPAEDYDAEDASVEHNYETTHDTGVTTFVVPNFRLEPATFYLEVGQSIEIKIHFSATDTRQFTYHLQIEGDNGEKVPLTLVAISDAVRLELLRWPAIPNAIVPRSLGSCESPWSLVPWQLSWQRPGVQVGSSETQTIEISNGGYLEAKLKWCFVEVPKALLSYLAVGGKQRLSDDIMKTIHRWPVYDPAKHGQESCPFTVSPASATLSPFSKTTFTFAFYAYQPVNHCQTIFAYLAATELPDSRHCLLHHNQLQQLQDTMQPSGYIKGLSLFGGAVSTLVDTEVPSDEPKLPSRLTSFCAVTAICLSGRSIAPKVSCLPPLVALSGDVLPFVAHEREVILRNTGSMPAYFRFRLTNQMPASCAEMYDPLWIVGTHEVPPRPGPPPSPQGNPEDPSEQLLSMAERLASQWPPLPPFHGKADANGPGFGALATVAIEPHCGRILPGGFLKVSVTLRIGQESDIDAHLLVDLPTSMDDNAESVVPPMKIRVLAAVRAPRVEVRGTSFLDYGVVRAHARHSLKLRLDNPSDMPTVVRLRHRPEEKDETSIARAAQFKAEGPPTARSALGDAPRRATAGVGTTPRTDRAIKDAEEAEAFPVASHEDVVQLFMDAVRSGTCQGSLPIRDTQEANVEPWVHARSGCLDQSGRKKHQFHGRGRVDIPEESILEDDFAGVPEDCDFIFQPECVALWPHQSTEVDVTLRSRFVGKYDALVEVLAFDSGHSQCVGAEAEVQLPKLRLSTQHAHFDITYVKVASPVYELELFNDYDMPANFVWNIPIKLEACIEVQIAPDKGVVPPRSSVRLKLIAVPTRESEYANLLCQVFAQDCMQPLALQISARVYGPEVDYAVVPAGAEPPVIIHEPRTADEEAGCTYQICAGQAPADSPTFDFGEMELLKTKTMQLVLYNRTGIPTPFGISIDKYGAFDPLSKGKKIGSLLEAATRMYSLTQHAHEPAGGTMKPDELVQTFSNEPQPASEGRQPSVGPDTSSKENTKQSNTSKKSSMPRAKSRTSGGFSGSRFDPKARRKQDKSKACRWLLDDKHEMQAFRSDVGADFALQKELKEQGMIALKGGRGYAITVDPKSDWLQPFSKSTITCTCYSDVPGEMEDELVITIGQLQSHAEGGDFRIPLRVCSRGNPLYLPDQQVGLRNKLDPACLLMETITPAAKLTTRTFRVGNSSMTKVRLSWKIMSQLQVQANQNRFVRTDPPKIEAVDEEPKDDVVEEGELTEEEAAQKAADEAAPGDAAPEGQEASADGAEVGITFGDLASLFVAWTNLRCARVGCWKEASGVSMYCAECTEEAEKEEPPQVEDPFAIETGEPPVKIEPEEAVLPVQGTATFTVTMLASKATTTSEGHYQYRLIGEGRWAQEPEAVVNDEATATQQSSLETTQRPAVEDGGPLAGARGAAKLARGVARLPEIKLDDAELHDDDSDIERIPSGRKEADKTQKAGERASSKEVVQDIISTLTIDCIGDCIIPRLIVDKKCDHEVQEFADEDDRQVPVFKFVHSTVAATGDKQRNGPGVKLLGQAGGTPHQGIASSLVREVTLANENACPVYCRLRTEGPFRIKVVEQAGKKQVVPLVVEKVNKKLRPKEGDKPEDPMRQLFVVPARNTLTLSVEFVPSLVPKHQWTANIEHIFRGDVVVEYPRDDSLPDSVVDLQRVHLLATSRKPSIRLNLIPITTLDPPDEQITTMRADLTSGLEQPPLLIEFGYVHVETAIARTRVILLSSANNVIAKWRIFHVGRKEKRKTLENGTLAKDTEDFYALDDREAFAFDVSEGELLGPSKDGLVPGSDVRMPKWCPTTPALPKRLPHVDEWQFEPKKVVITFKPSKNEVYKCRFRVQVEEGRSIDFICRGHGSYNEEDDAMDYQEA